MKVSELTGKKASQVKPSLKDILFALEDGQEPDAKTVKVLERMMYKAEKDMLKRVLANPDNFGIEYDVKVREIRSGTNIHTTHVAFNDEGLCFMMMVDTDDIGGSSDNHEDFCVDWSGAPVAGEAGESEGLLDAQDGFFCEK